MSRKVNEVVEQIYLGVQSDFKVVMCKPNWHYWTHNVNRRAKKARKAGQRDKWLRYWNNSYARYILRFRMGIQASMVPLWEDQE